MINTDTDDSLEIITAAGWTQSAIEEELREAVTNSGAFVDTQQRDWETRACVWAGQSDDGRKHADNLGVVPFPWEGAADTRVRLADAVINEQVMVMMAALRRGKIQSRAVGPEDAALSRGLNKIIEWTMRTRLRKEIEREAELAANWRQTYGKAVMGVFWEQKLSVEQSPLDMKAMVEAVMQSKDPAAAAELKELVDMVQDPLRQEELIERLLATSPLLDRTKARAVAEALKTVGYAEVPIPSVLTSRPRWQALRAWVDVFFPTETKTLEDARWVARREWITEAELRERVVTAGWDADWVEEAATKKGAPGMFDRDWWGFRTSKNNYSGWSDDTEDLIEVVHFYHRAVDPKTHAPQIFCTVLSPAVRDKFAKQEPFTYKHGRFPFVELVRERTDFAIADSRSIPELAAPWQSEIKLQRDSRTDRTTIATLPPLVVPSNRGKSRLEFGPGVQHTERRPGELRWMSPPPADQGAIEIERATSGDANRYFGRMSEEVPAPLFQLHQQHLVDKWLGEMVEAAVMTIQLMQQYMDPAQVERVAGPLPWDWDSLEIRGQYDVLIEFDVRDLDTEYLGKKLELLNKFALPLDTFGIVDRTALVSTVLEWIDPALARKVLRSQEAATDAEVEDEKANFALMFSGVEPKMVEKGQNFGLRKQVLEGILKSNPEAQQMLQGRPQFAAVLQNRLKHLDFQVKQEQNAQTGRVGAEPVQPQRPQIGGPQGGQAQGPVGPKGPEGPQQPPQ